MKSIEAFAVGLILILAVLWEAFETIILPRRVTRRFRLTRLFYRFTWRPWSAAVGRIRSKHRRETFLSFYGPISLLGLLTLWALCLMVGFAFLHRAAGLTGPGMDLYMSGATFFTLGFSDTTPISWLSRIVTITEAGRDLPSSQSSLDIYP